MTQQRWHSLAPLTGLAFFVLVVAAFIVGGETPATDDSIQEIKDYYDDEAAQVITSALLGWASVFLVFFGGILRTVLRSAGDAAERLATVAFGGSVLFAAGMLSFAGFNFALVDTVDDISPQAIQALNALNSDFFFMLAGGAAILMIAAGIAIIRFRVLPVWLGWIALILGILCVTPAGFFAFLLACVWIAIVSIMLWRAPAAAPAGQTQMPT